MTLPDHIDLGDGLHLRHFTVDDAAAVAAAVGASLDHLRPWMPWADEQSAQTEFQRERLQKLPAQAARGEEWQYGLFERDKPGLLGSFGLMTRRGPGTIEIGYWVHVDAAGRGLATRAASALTDAALAEDGVTRVYICCDEANARSAAIPRRLGFDLLRVERRAPEAPGEQGRLMMWARDRGRTGSTGTASPESGKTP
jgi:RimJ/RimL family protein N-acetyltransferase